MTIAFAARPGVKVPTGPVSFTAEPVALAGVKRPAWLEERNVLGSGRALDLDGDGKKTGRWPLGCLGPDLLVGETVVAGLGGEPFRYPPAMARLGAGGVVLYGRCGSHVSLGFGPGPVAVETMPGPLLQVSVAARAGAALSVRGWKLNNEPINRLRVAEVQAYEVVEGDQAEWLTVWWVLIPVPATGSHLVDFVVEGEGAGMVAAGINVAPAPGARWRGPFGGKPLP
ncbi:MAG: hypothetical protein H6706_04455 [Myxococcales bacterium]|nr:hypothetical protein [Myxococcales bacterium]